MALIECKECKHKISKKAKTCPNCGAKNQQTNWFGAIIIVLIFFYWMGSSTSGSRNSYSTSLNYSATEVPTIAQPMSWSYYNSEYKMGGTIKTATLNSENKLSFSFPYNGLQRATLTLRKHPRHGSDAFISVEKGQFLCSSYDGCIIRVKFDDQKVQTFSASEPSDHSTETIFISNYTRFVGQLKKAKKINIEAEFYQEGNQVMEFSVEGLQW